MSSQVGPPAGAPRLVSAPDLPADIEVGRQVGDEVGPEGEPARPPAAPPVGPQDPVSAWLAWHGFELALTGVPLLAAAAWEWWVALLAVPTGVLWAVAEIRRAARPADRTEGDDDDR